MDKDDAQELEKWDRVGHENRTHIKAKSLQRKPNDLFRENYSQIAWW